MKEFQQIEQIALEKVPVWCRRLVELDVLVDARASTSLDEVFEQMCVEIRGFVLAEEVGEVKHGIAYPKDWWQAFKARWFPQWALRRWPVKERRVEWVVDIKCAYPHFRPALPKEKMKLVPIVQLAEDLT